MSKYLTKLISLILSLNLILEQSLFAQAMDFSHYFANSAKPVLQSDKFRPLHLRFLGYDNLSNDFKIFLDKGDTKKEDLANKTYVEENTQTLLKYFFIGLVLPNEKFWVNLRPDSSDNILDPDLEKTDIGRIFLEADVQLKKDTAGMTSPQTKEGREYWDKLYKKAGELFGSENITIPTITRPWIVPNEIIIREAPDNAYIYKATLKVMLEEDYLKSSQPSAGQKAAVGLPIAQAAVSFQQSKSTYQPLTSNYNFSDPRLKELNQYSTQLIKETIIPKLTYEVNTSKRYAPLKQVYYSLILAQWFKARYVNKDTTYSRLINRKDLTNLLSKESWSKSTYFKQYQKSFKDGEYNISQPVYTPSGQTIRSYFSGGISGIAPSMPNFGAISIDPKTGTVSSSIASFTSPNLNPNIIMDVKVELFPLNPEKEQSSVGSSPLLQRNKGMPIIWERFKQYDLDNSGDLSVEEIKLMPFDDIGDLFEYSFLNKGISFDLAYIILKGLSMEDISIILPRMLGTKETYFHKMVDLDFSMAVEIIFEIKETVKQLENPFAIKGGNAFSLLHELSPEIKEKILSEVKEKENQCKF